MPVRLQRKRTLGSKLPNDCKIVTRPGRFANPFKVGMYAGYDAANAVRDFRKWINRDLTVRSAENVFGKPPTCEEIRDALAGRDLACWCKLDQPCHADVLLEIANGPALIATDGETNAG